MYAERVRGGGDRGTVEALVKIENGADASDLATKGDLDRMEAKLDAKIDLLRSDLSGKFTLLQWMLGLLLAGVASIVVKTFF